MADFGSSLHFDGRKPTRERSLQVPRLSIETLRRLMQADATARAIISDKIAALEGAESGRAFKTSERTLDAWAVTTRDDSLLRPTFGKGSIPSNSSVGFLSPSARSAPRGVRRDCRFLVTGPAP